MDNDVTLLLLRLVAGGSLLMFMGGIAYFLARDYRLAAEQVENRRRSYGRLVVISNGISNPPTGTQLPLFPSTTLGRAPNCTIQIHDSYASNEHARVVQRLGQWWLEDRQSKNGTRLNGDPVNEPVVLSPGDIIMIGSLQLRLELDA